MDAWVVLVLAYVVLPLVCLALSALLIQRASAVSRLVRGLPRTPVQAETQMPVTSSSQGLTTTKGESTEDVDAASEVAVPASKVLDREPVHAPLRAVQVEHQVALVDRESGSLAARAAADSSPVGERAIDREPLRLQELGQTFWQKSESRELSEDDLTRSDISMGEPSTPASGTRESAAMRVLQARNAEDLTTTRYLLLAVLHDQSAQTDDLEAAGDSARFRLQDKDLARQFYQKAVERDPGNISARAELLHSLASDPEKRAEAREEIFTLARENPNRGVVISRLMDFLIEVEDFAAMEEMALELLPSSSEKARLTRNIALARAQLGRPKEEVLEAYAKAWQTAEESNKKGNVAHTYGNYLLSIGELGKAIEILVEGIQAEPRHASLYRVLGDVYRRKGGYELAKRAYNFSIEYGDMRDQHLSRLRIQDTEALEAATAIIPSSTPQS